MNGGVYWRRKTSGDKPFLSICVSKECNIGNDLSTGERLCWDRRAKSPSVEMYKMRERGRKEGRKGGWKRIRVGEGQTDGWWKMCSDPKIVKIFHRKTGPILKSWSVLFIQFRFLNIRTACVKAAWAAAWAAGELAALGRIACKIGLQRRKNNLHVRQCEFKIKSLHVNVLCECVIANIKQCKS